MNAADAWPGERLIKAEQCTLIWSEPLRGGGREVVKMYRRRPLADPIRRWFVPYRVEREFHLLELLFEGGVPCPEPLWWSHGRSPQHGRHEHLATREIAGTIPLVHWLRGQGPGARPDLSPVFRIARRMHECGISHGAFYPTNILAAPRRSPVGFFVIDMAHGCRFPQSIVGTLPAAYDLLDMLRGISRRHPIDDCERWISGYGLSAADRQRLLARLPDHRLERPWRHIRRAGTDARAVWQRFLRPDATAAASRASAGAP